MSDPKQMFIEYCGGRYERFMDALYANPQGEIQLKAWQEALLNKMYAENPDFPVDQAALLELIRDGTEMLHKCNVRDCWGDVGCIDRASDLWGCGECGKQWRGQRNLLRSLAGESLIERLKRNVFGGRPD